MALKVEIKPGERIIIGNAVITNDGHRARFYIEGQTPILREKDIMRPKDADTPCKKIYLTVLTMYLSEEPDRHHEVYFELTNDVQAAAPSTAPHIAAINTEILAGNYYKALKRAQTLIAYEKELMEHASRP